tara:strand:+ start:194 stop:409 length:216 start_codon:yes stop_codon:yes gene_type:complete
MDYIFNRFYIGCYNILNKQKGNMKNKFIKKKIKGIEVDVRTKDCLYITIGKWVVYIDNSTNEKIIDTWENK